MKINIGDRIFIPQIPDNKSVQPLWVIHMDGMAGKVFVVERVSKWMYGDRPDVYTVVYNSIAYHLRTEWFVKVCTSN